MAAASARSAWAVGYTYPIGAGVKTLTEHWNGTTWKRVPSPSPPRSTLRGVAAISARSAWAVGYTGSGKTLILRWNGKAWK